MTEKIGRNDPCPCGSGKKYKACCLQKESAPKKRKFSAAVIGKQKPVESVDLMERTFGNGLAKTKEGYTPPEESTKE